MKTTIRDAVVNCSPTKMQKNSAANSAPARRPPGSVPSRSKSEMPRARAQSQSNAAAPVDRSAACHNAPISGSAAFAATWFSPQRKQQTTRVVTARASRWLLRSRRAMGSVRSTVPSDGVDRALRGTAARACDRVADDGGGESGDEAARVRERRRRDVPSRRSAHRRSPRRFARDLDRETGEDEDADRAPLAASVCRELPADARGAGVQHARQARVVEQVGAREQTELRQRPGDEPRNRRRERHAREPPERSDERDTDEVDDEVERGV